MILNIKIIKDINKLIYMRGRVIEIDNRYKAPYKLPKNSINKKIYLAIWMGKNKYIQPPPPKQNSKILETIKNKQP